MKIKTLIKRVRDLAADHPDAVYNMDPRLGKCAYTIGEAGGGTGCIFGQALKDLVAPDMWEEWQRTERRYSTSPGSITDLLDCHSDVEIGSDEYYWCQHVQDRQDNKMTWGEAIESADQSYPLVKEALSLC